jgi:hypothetical protein
LYCGVPSGFNHVEIAKMLIEENAPLEVRSVTRRTPQQARIPQTT